MKRIGILILSLIFIFNLSFSGCLNDDEIHFSIYYSSSSTGVEQFDLTITTNNIEVFNDTVTPRLGEGIYQEEASGHEYFIVVDHNDDISEISITPDGHNGVSVEFIDGNIQLHEVTD